MNWQRRPSASYELLQLPLASQTARIRTWSDSIAETATAEEIADRDSELAEARRGSTASTGRHVTDFLASQTLALFLAVSPAAEEHHPTVKFDDGLIDIVHPQADEDVVEASLPNHDFQQRSTRRRSSSHLNQQRRWSVLNRISIEDDHSSSSTEAAAVAARPWRRFSERFSGASWIMASARLRRSSNLTAAVSSSTSRLELDEPVNSRSDELSSNITAIPSLGDSTVVSRKKSSTDGPSPSIIANATSSESRSQSLKKYSQSSPALPQLHYDLNNLGRSKSRQKKFLRLFPNVPRDEKVLNHYSCALVGDLLRQGHLYITYNYIAFHSNVFGYVTKLLISMGDVRKITKEKTAKIIPNAIGISTAEEKHTFGSLMNRDVVYRLVVSIWKKFHFPNGGPSDVDCVDGERENEGSSQNGEHSSNESYSQHSAEGMIISLPPSRPDRVSSSVHVTSATEGTSSELEENDSAIERSYSPTPERVTADDLMTNNNNNNNKRVAPGFTGLGEASSSLAISKGSIYNFFSSRTNLFLKDDDGHGDDDGSPRVTRKDPLSNEEEDFAPPSPSSDYTDTREWLESEQSRWFLPVRSWAYAGIGVLLVILCLSAGLLWYRMSLLHSHLEMRLLSDGVAGRQSSHQPASVSAMYTQQVQDLVDSLHTLLSSRSSTGNEQGKNVPKLK